MTKVHGCQHGNTDQRHNLGLLSRDCVIYLLTEKDGLLLLPYYENDFNGRLCLSVLE